MIKKPKNVNGIYWAYFSPEGYIQVRSIAETRKLSREMIAFREYDWDKKITYKDYEKKGYYVKNVHFQIAII